MDSQIGLPVAIEIFAGEPNRSVNGKLVDPARPRFAVGDLSGLPTLSERSTGRAGPSTFGAFRDMRDSPVFSWS